MHIFLRCGFAILNTSFPRIVRGSHYIAIEQAELELMHQSNNSLLCLWCGSGLEFDRVALKFRHSTRSEHFFNWDKSYIYGQISHFWTNLTFLTNIIFLDKYYIFGQIGQILHLWTFTFLDKSHIFGQISRFWTNLTERDKSKFFIDLKAQTRVHALKSSCSLV